MRDIRREASPGIKKIREYLVGLIKKNPDTSLSDLTRLYMENQKKDMNKITHVEWIRTVNFVRYHLKVLERNKVIISKLVGSEKSMLGKRTYKVK